MPARIVDGIIVKGGVKSITHVWVECWIDGVGWMTVTGAGCARHYQARPGWERELVVDLQVSAADAARGAGA